MDPMLLNNRFEQSTSITTTELPYEFDKERPRGSTENVVLDGLQQDLSELIHILHVAERPSVKEVIQADIQLILVKIESLEHLDMNQLETNISWSRVTGLKHNKSKYKKYEVSDPFQLTPNRYNLLGNDAKEDEDITLVKANSSSASITNQVTKIKTNHKKKNVVKKVHKVLILGDSHARGCASEVKQKLKSEYEIVGFTNPGSTMKDIIVSAKSKIAQLTTKDVVVPPRGKWVGGGGNLEP